MTNIKSRLELFQKYFLQLSDISLARKPLLLLMLTQAEAIVREIKIELGHLKPEPIYKPVEKEHTEKYYFKPQSCCGRVFSTPQQWAGHQNSKYHRTNGKAKREA